MKSDPLQSSCLLWLICLLHGAAPVGAEEPEPPAAESPTVLAGHSYHGEVFNEGPRQRAYLMSSLGHVRFPVTTDKVLAQKFVTQGVAQLHGFWYFEAERSFRQAAAIDPQCAMAYWGMALANKGNEKRAKAFIAEAVKRKQSASRREQLYIDALHEYLNTEDGKKKERSEKYAKALERLIYEFPDDVEAKAFLALQLWDNRSSGSPISSFLAVDALLEQVFEAEPLHPAHHYRIHLWDLEKPEKALESAASCGQSLPAIAHMWHMSGHIYSRLKRYGDAAWQQEASARVDHAHMMRDRILPDQIHNFAHNNEWLIRDLNHVGRVRDAVDLAKNMIELPRHPKYNTLAKRGSYSFGRERLFETLSKFELWDEMIALCDSPYLDPTDDLREQTKRLRYLGQAHWRRGDAEQGASQVAALRALLEEQQSASDQAGAAAEAKARQAAVDQKQIDEAVAAAGQKAQDDGADEAGIAKARQMAEDEMRGAQLKAKEKDITKAKEDAQQPFKSKISDLEKALQELEGLQAWAQGEHARALELLRKAGDVDPMFLAHVQLAAGETDKAIEAARKHVNSHQNEVQPLALLADLLWKAGRKEEAQEAFQQLREISGPVDLPSPPFDRLASLTSECGYPADWRVEQPPSDDVGVRPTLDALGPFRWEPSAAPEFVLPDAEQTPHALKDYQGRPLVLIFYLGYGCLHCAEQLQAFGPQREKFLHAGIDLLAISSDDPEGLKKSIANYTGGPLPIPLLSDGQLEVFQRYRVYDDFEQRPLHGTFLIDGHGRVRWQDISYQPFMDVDFLLQESQRLLSQSEWARGHGASR